MNNSMMNDTTHPNPPDNSSLLTILAAALLFGRVDPSALKLPGQVDLSALKLSDRELRNSTGDSRNRATVPADPGTSENSAEPAEGSVSEGPVSHTERKGYSAPAAAKTFCDWLTANMEGRFHYACILKLGRKIKECPDFPGSTDLAANCSQVLELNLTPEELEGFVRAWMAYDAYLVRWRYETRKAQNRK